MRIWLTMAKDGEREREIERDINKSGVSYQVSGTIWMQYWERKVGGGRGRKGVWR